MTRGQPHSVAQVSVVCRRRRVSTVNEHGSVGHLVSAGVSTRPPAAFVADDINDARAYRGVMKVRNDGGRCVGYKMITCFETLKLDFAFNWLLC